MKHEGAALALGWLAASCAVLGMIGCHGNGASSRDAGDAALRGGGGGKDGTGAGGQGGGPGLDGPSGPVTLDATLTIQEALYPGAMAGLDRTDEPFCMGVPVADSASVVGTETLGLAGASAGQFRVLGR